MPQDHPQALLLRDAAELSRVGLAAPVELTRLRLVQIPEQIRADRVQAHRLGHLQPVTPVFHRHTRRVNFAAADLQALAVEEKIIRADGEGVLRWRRFHCGAGNGGQYSCGDENGK